MAERTLVGMVEFWSRWQPDRPAVSGATDRATWADLDRDSERIACGLIARGIAPGSTVGILLRNCVDYVVVAVAVLRAGCITAPLNPRLTVTELRITAVDAGLVLIVCDATTAAQTPAFDGVCAVVECGMDRGAALRALGGSPTTLPPLDAGTAALLSYTSGSDGLPKGVVLSDRNVTAAAAQRLPIEALSTSSRVLLPSALAYTGGLIVSFFELVLHSGGELVVLESFDADQVIRTVEDRRITHMNIASPILDALMEVADPHDLSSVQSVCIGGATVVDRTLETALRLEIPVSPSYGQTECAGGATFLRPADLARKFGTSGQPHMHTDVRICGPEGHRVEAGSVGEIEVRSRAVMLGYWNRPADTAGALHNGWLRTDDLGSVDDDGFLTLTGRKKQMIISGGLNVYPAEVERVFQLMADVQDVVVIGRPDERWGQVPLLVITPRPGSELTLAAIVEHGRTHLADYKRPRYVALRTQPLPRTVSGKLARADVVRVYADSDEGVVAVENSLFPTN